VKGAVIVLAVITEQGQQRLQARLHARAATGDAVTGTQRKDAT